MFISHGSNINIFPHLPSPPSFPSFPPPLSPFQVLDYEARPSYTLTVEVTNRDVDPRFVALGPFSDRATVRLLVKNVDEPPVFSSDLAKMAAALVRLVNKTSNCLFELCSDSVAPSHVVTEQSVDSGPGRG